MKVIKKIIAVILSIIEAIFVLSFLSVIITDLEKKTTPQNGLYVTLIIIIIILYIIIKKLWQAEKKKAQKTKDEVLPHSNQVNILKTNTYKPINTYIIESPFNALIEDEKRIKTIGVITGKELYQLLSKEDIKNICNKWNQNKIETSLDNKNVKKKVEKIILHLNKKGTCYFIINTNEPLNNEEKNYLLNNFLPESLSNIWKENAPDLIYDKVNKKNIYNKEEIEGTAPQNYIFYKLIFNKEPKIENWYIKYIDEELHKEVIKKLKHRTEKDCYKIELSEETPNILSNKIGGTPYLPVGEEYPKSQNGKPMTLLLQLNLKDIDLPNYPKEGILEIFITSNPFSEEFTYVIKHFKSGLEYQRELPKITTTDETFIPSSYAINLKRAKDYMPPSDFRYDNLIKEIIRDILELSKEEARELFGESYEGIIDQIEYEYQANNITIGGYADFTQSDPRGINIEEDKTECLLKLNSEEDYEKFQVGDGGIIYAIISPKDLESSQFEKAFVNWDCY